MKGETGRKTKSKKDASHLLAQLAAEVEDPSHIVHGALVSGAKDCHHRKYWDALPQAPPKLLLQGCAKRK